MILTGLLTSFYLISLNHLKKNEKLTRLRTKSVFLGWIALEATLTVAILVINGCI